MVIDREHLEPAQSDCSSGEAQPVPMKPVLVAVAVALVVWALKCAFLAHYPLRKLALTPWLIDDSFITMRIARNFALGNGYSFDGVHSTTGTSPVWTLLTALNHLGLDLDAAAKLTAMESAFFGAAATVLVFYLTFLLFNKAAAWFAFSLITLLPVPFLNAMNGMETALFTVLGLLALILYLREGACARPAPAKGRLLLGLVLGLMCAVRIDGLFLVAAGAAVELTRIAAGLHKGEGWPRIRSGCWLILGLVLPLLPVLAWSLHVDGTLLPANQVGRRFLAWQDVLQPGGAIDWRLYWARLGYYLEMYEEIVSVGTGASVVAVAAVCLGLGYAAARPFSALVLLYFVAYSLVLVLYQRYFPNVQGLRYLNLFVHLAAIVSSGLVCRAVSGASLSGGSAPLGRIARVCLHACLIGVVVVASALQYKYMLRKCTWLPEQRVLPEYNDAVVAEAWSMVDWINENLPDGTALASKDHGRLAYFTHARIVDLAGILDPEITRQLQAGTLREYLDALGTAYYVPGRYRVHQEIESVCVVEPAWTPRVAADWNPPLFRIKTHGDALRPGETLRIDFAQPASGLCLREGWGHRESDGRWSVADSASLEFELDPSRAPQVRVRARTFGPQRVLVSLNQNTPHAIEIDYRDYAEYTLDLPAEEFGRRNRLTFHLPDCVSPARLRGSTDTRTLGIRVAWVEVSN